MTAPGSTDRRTTSQAPGAPGTSTAAATRAGQARDAADEQAEARSADPAPTGTGHRSSGPSSNARTTGEQRTGATSGPLSTPGQSGSTARERQPGGDARDRATKAVAFVEDAVPSRSTALLVALGAAVLALLGLVAREWTR